MSQQVIKQALDNMACMRDMVAHPDNLEFIDNAIASLNQAIAEPEKHEPVAEVTSETGAEIKMSWWHEPALPIGTKLYTTPQQRKPLTDEQIGDQFVRFQVGGMFTPFLYAVRAIEAAHGIKENT